MHRGYIKLWRKTIEWEWYKDTVTKCVFLHLLLTANHQEKKWKGITIKRGEALTGRKKLASDLHFSEMQIRSALNHLKSTNEITIKTTNKYSLIELLNYETYNNTNQQDNQQTTNKQPTSNQQVTTTKNVKNVKNDKNDKKSSTKIKQSYGNPEINKMLEALKAKVGIEMFVDSSIERNLGKHCVSLIDRIGKDEFVRRLDILLEDGFHTKNMNKIKYIYNNIKGFKEPQNNIAIIS